MTYTGTTVHQIGMPRRRAPLAARPCRAGTRQHQERFCGCRRRWCRAILAAKLAIVCLTARGLPRSARRGSTWAALARSARRERPGRARSPRNCASGRRARSTRRVPTKLRRVRCPQHRPGGTARCSPGRQGAGERGAATARTRLCRPAIRPAARGHGRPLGAAVSPIPRCRGIGRRPRTPIRRATACPRADDAAVQRTLSFGSGQLQVRRVRSRSTARSWREVR